jgi:epoxyqueuosine reductase
LDLDNRHGISQWIKKRSAELGFAACGLASAEYLEKDDKILRYWLSEGYQGKMTYLERNHDKRVDPVKLMPGARSIIVLLKNYYPENKLPEEDNYHIAKYAYGNDYHDVIREKLKLLISDLGKVTGPFQARAFTDSAPVLERAWAERAGLGWIGKNTCLINPKLGSYVFIAEIITDLELDYDTRKINDFCGGCNKCIEACPTAALVSPHILDSRKCISYLTIECQDPLPEDEKTNLGDWIFGCDICQEVCPWNRKATPHSEEAFEPSNALMEMSKTKWEKLTRDEFDVLFKDSAMKRTRFDGLRRNIDFLRKM